MAGSIGSLSLVITANTAGLESGLAKAKSLISGLAMGGGMAELVRESLSLAAAAEQAELRFSALFGSAEDGVAALSDLRDLARKGGFAFEDLEQGARRLAEAGLSAEQTTGLVRELGAVSAGTGRPVAELAETMSRVAERGSMSARELRQLGGPVLDELARELGTTRLGLHALAEEGAIGPPQLAAAFRNLTGEGGRFSGSLAARANSLTGMWQTLKSQLSETGAAIGKTYGAAIGGAGALAGVFGAVRGFAEWVRPAYEQIASLGRAMWAVPAQAWDDFGRPAWEGLKAVAGTARQALGFVGDYTVSLSDVFLGFYRLNAEGAAYVVTAIGKIGGALIAYVAAPLSGPVLTAVGYVGSLFLTVYKYVAEGANRYLVAPIADALHDVIKLGRDALHEITSHMPSSAPGWQKLHDAEEALFHAEGRLGEAAAGNAKLALPDVDGFRKQVDDLKGAVPDALKALGGDLLAKPWDAGAQAVDDWFARVKDRMGKANDLGLKAPGVDLEGAGGKVREAKLTGAAVAGSREAASIIAHARLQDAQAAAMRQLAQQQQATADATRQVREAVVQVRQAVDRQQQVRPARF